jgi:hypothetical protein
MTKKTAAEVTMDILKDESQVVDFITPVLETFTKLQMVKKDAKTSKVAKEYTEQVESQMRDQLKFLYMAAQQAFPEDGIDPEIAHSSIGPTEILNRYDFKVIVTRK